MYGVAQGPCQFHAVAQLLLLLLLLLLPDSQPQPPGPLQPRHK
jgi:hypothetical protein